MTNPQPAPTPPRPTTDAAAPATYGAPRQPSGNPVSGPPAGRVFDYRPEPFGYAPPAAAGYAGHPPAPAGYPPSPVGYPAPPPARRRGPVALIVAAAVALVLVMGAGVVGVALLSGSPGYLAALGAGNREQAVSALLTRRADAVRKKDRTAFLADVHDVDAGFVSRQRTVFDNLTKLPFSTFTYELAAGVNYDRLLTGDLASRFGDSAFAPGVTVAHRIEGVDTVDVPAPWVPVFAVISGRWKLVSELNDQSLPTGVGGQPWDAGPIVVNRGDRVVGVFSADATSGSAELMTLAEDALDKVAAVRPSGWAGKILVTAVRDRHLFDTYFADQPDRAGHVRAIAVPYYSSVTEWKSSTEYVTTRIVFNPDDVGAEGRELLQVLAHEFVHAAMGPVTVRATPLWLVEGIAEYVAYKGERINDEALKRALRGIALDDLKSGAEFYDGQGESYLTAWLACRMIAERYGEAKLFALYEAFQTTSGEATAINRILGVSRPDLIAQWQAYVRALQ